MSNSSTPHPEPAGAPRQSDPADTFKDDDGFVDEREASGSRKVHSDGKTFLESLGESLKNAGDTATRYTRMGMAHAELEKLRYDLKKAHSALGEAVTRCWDHAPQISLTPSDPELAEALKAVKEARQKIRTKQAEIAGLKQETKN